MRARDAAICVVMTAAALAGQSVTDSSEGAFLEAAPVISSGSPTAPAISDDRILGIIPNFTTVSDPHQAVAPLTVRDKWMLFVKETVDPFTFASAAMGAAMSQEGNTMPQYGHGRNAYFQRVGAATADMATQNFFSTALLAPLFHQDPRYYRMGPEHNIARRILYSVSRQFITRQDSGRAAFNISGVLGMGMGIALSNAYYPGADVDASVNRSRFLTSISGNCFGNLLPEFWPDIQHLQKKLFHHKN
jgi:hypothetical protein